TCKTISACHFLLRDLNRRILSEDDVSVKNAYAKKIEETRNNIVSIKQSNEERRLENQRIAEERAESRRKKMNCMSRQECFEACNMIYSAGYNYIYKRNKCYSDCRRGWYYLPGTSYGRKVCK
ncbi:MAG TPA: hypothetical protein PK253_17620, partial [Spirochaetota bacterium]|nr:hypothetical protein [Spirochaetota bacterium]